MLSISLPSAVPSAAPIESGPIVRKYILAKPTMVAPPVPAPPVSVDPTEAAAMGEEGRAKLLDLFQKILSECATLQSESTEAMGAEVHKVITLRAPVVAKVSTLS